MTENKKNSLYNALLIFVCFTQSPILGADLGLRVASESPSNNRILLFSFNVAMLELCSVTT